MKADDVQAPTDLHRAMGLVIAAGGLDHTLRTFRVPGEPYAKARARKRKHGGYYMPAEQVAAEEAIAWAAKRGGQRFDGNVAVAAVFYRSNHHRIDVDNLLKTVLDGITKSNAVWADDSHVTALVGVVEWDAEWARTVIALAPHRSTLVRGDDAMTQTCPTCGKKFKPHSPTNPATYCSRACRPKGRPRICVDCGGPTSAPHVRRCRSCYFVSRRAAA